MAILSRAAFLYAKLINQNQEKTELALQRQSNNKKRPPS